jgi:butyrate kinase
MDKRILVINPGSTSTKLALFQGEQKLFDAAVRHSKEDLSPFSWVMEQADFRQTAIEKELSAHNVDLTTLDAVCARGGQLPYCAAGTYLVDQDMVDFMYTVRDAAHASNLGCVLALRIARPLGIPAFICDPVTVDEMTDEARISGHPMLPRMMTGHALNCRAMALRYAREHGKHYEELNLIVAHLGGGISASVHRHGEIIDSVGDDDGQFSPERSGCVPSLGLIKLCYSGKYTYEEMRKKIRGRGGMYAHLGTSDCRVIEQMIRDGDRHADLIFQAQAYQIAKAIGLLSIVLKGDCDAIILTGGVANSKMLTERVEDYVKFIAPVCVMPGENEMEALALGGMRILQGEENARIYHILNGVNGKEGQG